MSAANSVPSSDVSADKRPYEPSMEEILASIRRIIADDQSLPSRTVPREPEAAPVLPVAKDVRRPIPPVAPLESTGSAAQDAAANLTRLPDGPPVGRVAKVEHVEPNPAAARNEPPQDATIAHGSIAAPQFAMPDGPVVPVVEEPRPPQLQPAPARPQPATPRHVDVPTRQIEPERDGSREVEPTATPERPELFSAATDTAVSAAFNMLAASRLADNSDELMTLVRDMIRPLLRSWIDDHLPAMVERMVRAEIERVARGGR